MRWIHTDEIEANGERCEFVDVMALCGGGAGDDAVKAADGAGFVGELGELTSYVDTFLAGLHDRVGELTGVAGHRQMAAVLGEVERVIRGAEAASVAVVGDAEVRGLYHSDQHRSVRNWVRAAVRVGGDVALGRVRTAKLFRHVPLAGELLAQGSLGVAQSRELAKAHANPRCGDQLGDVADELLESAMNDDLDTFRDRTREWVRLADEDGAHREARAAHEGRHCHLSRVGDRFVLSGAFGVIQGESLLQVLDAFANAEYHADRDAAVAARGNDDVHDSDLARTPAQRRADALLAICLAAAGAPADAGKEIDVCVNIVIDHATFEQQLANLIADVVDPLHVIRNQRPGYQPFTPEPCGYIYDGADPDSDVRRMCHTLDGSPVDPVQAVVMALVGHARRVVLGAKGLVIDLGRKRRCYTGAAREAVLLQASIDGSTRCMWPACGRRHCQIDHATEWSDQGRTEVGNGDPLCTHHNLRKTSGYTARRDDRGRWHFHRPDGTEIAPAA